MLNWKHVFSKSLIESHVFLKECSLSGYDQHPSPRPQPNNFSHHRSQRFITRCIKAQQGFYNVLIQITFTLSSNFKAFLFTDVDDFDMMH
jgi:hypothetical protein